MEAENEINFGNALHGAAGMMRVAQLRDVKAALEDPMTQRLKDFNAGRLRIGLSQAEGSEESDEYPCDEQGKCFHVVPEVCRPSS